MTGLKEKRKAANITQEQLAYKLGVSYSTIRRWDKSCDTIPANKLVMLSDILKCSIDDVLGRNR